MDRIVLVLLVVLAAMPNCHSEVRDEYTMTTAEKSLPYECNTKGKCYDKFHGKCVNATEAKTCPGIVKNASCSLMDGQECKCCLECPYKKCLVSGSSRCRKNCWRNEYDASSVCIQGICPSPCKCCRPCKRDPGQQGRCVGTCSANQYRVGTCSDGNCVLCRSCKPKASCTRARGHCVNIKASCEPGFSVSSNVECKSKDCKCCVPCPTNQICIDGPNPGLCLPDQALCNNRDEYISEENCCKDEDCSYCKKCKPRESCRALGGRCYRYIGEDTCRGPLPHSSSIGKCEAGACACCVACEIKGSCLGRPDTGMCVPNEEDCLEASNMYVSDEKCCDGCPYCKKCKANRNCSKVGGKCYRRTAGCPELSVETSEGTCINNDTCVCCVAPECPGQCSPDTECRQEEGVCVAAGTSCGEYREKSYNGTCGSDACKCCVPKKHWINAENMQS